VKLKPPQVKKLATAIQQGLYNRKLIKVLSSDAKVFAKIEGILLADLKIEEDIEKEARALLEKFHDKVESGEIDYQQMYVRVKKQLIKDKKFIP
jgi:hypothetical protein